MEKAGGGGLKRPWSGKHLELLLRELANAIEIVVENQAGEISRSEVKEGSKKCLPKANLCVGINNVTRTLERMPAKPAGASEGESQPKRSKTVDNTVTKLGTSAQQLHPKSSNVTRLQAVIVAADVQPKALVAHLGALCASRGVVILPVSGGDGSGSLKLGEVLGTRAAIAIGIKEGDTPINWAVESIMETRPK
ncbi:uncharacterized protein [Physcomitrium patens]|uniref:uncharacterized protein isoform X2 n=1 Tax=Physcomitrium patens TaxID=3218 RepID=UPI000D17AEAB|nr:uncharacterized protein LOC112273372 isoform X2 [Physcomitrium patens]|eukprot:XP_024357829.1 uncharacterized protein LOC112273372 isoform X2 [Physcomitrella patens]